MISRDKQIRIDIRSLFLPGTNVRGIGRYTAFLTQLNHPLLHLIPQPTSPRYFFYNSLHNLEKKLPKNRISFKFTHSSQLANIFIDNILLSATSKKNYTYHFPNIYLAPLLPPRGRIILTLHDLIPLEYPSEHLKGGFYNKTLYLHNLKIYSQKADIILTVSQTSRQQIIKRLQINPDKVKVVYNCVDDIFFSSPIVKTPQPYLLYVGGVDYRKNIPTIIRVFHQLKKESLTRKLIMVSADMFSQRNSETIEIRRLIKKLGLTTSIQLLSHLSDSQLLKVYQHAQLLIFPTLSEGFGYPIVEAMASGCPVLTSDIPVCHEIAGDGALFAPPKDEKIIISEAERLLTNFNLRRKLIQLGWKQAKKYTFSTFRQKMLDLYFQTTN